MGSANNSKMEKQNSQRELKVGDRLRDIDNGEIMILSRSDIEEHYRYSGVNGHYFAGFDLIDDNGNVIQEIR